ncbi:MAG: NAD-dependent epimerase/dehydratase family protein [Candidatus Omnitrophica bacterium]|nr:NAD-dependent epimerase/dehydratase family protein [Candidatus Omnitrophota bacterium]MBU1922900.1 NAD-dependent epimerase/dehydratase family protein [Candidatus Omnitrophota bacterium]
MKRAIITGGSGFVGANLARRLVRDGHEVTLLVKPGFDPWRIESIRKKIRIKEVNLLDRQALDQVIALLKPEWIFHLAVNGAYSYQMDLFQMIQTNIVGTVNLVESCLKSGFEVFVNTGSSSEYGFKDHAPSEIDYLEPNSYYAVTKATGTMFCRYIAQSNKVNIYTLRLYSVFGPYEEAARLIPALILRGIKGKFPPLVNPDIARDYVYTEDCVDAFIKVAEHKPKEYGAVYNVGSGIQTSLRQVAEVARKVLKIKAEPNWGSMPGRIWDTNLWVADNNKIKNGIGWKSKYNFEQGFRKTVNWFKENTELWEANLKKFRK